MQRLLATRGLDPDRLEAEGSNADSDRQPAVLELAERRIPPRYRQATADHPEVATWVRHVTLAARPGPGGAPGIATGPSLLIAGPTGTGKTHQTYGAVRGLVQAGVRLRWQSITAADLYAAQRPRQGHDSEREMRDLARCPLLMIDDLGAAKTSEWTEELTYRLINHRYEQILPTLFTTNVPIREIRTILGDRIASRLAEMTERAVLTGPDRRRHTA
ncbi:ATP-binding protein [Streptomyces sp. H39-C1]|uniref:ATP-binding protein n=1 Tax=Streptomyces sp. H39-C1 TaxID=3004355 RepID=UPI0022AEAFAE|nr:ATP-binding protein [Streptomyces sp. H39-C1]MCZ4103049.1 ATP-binding protein [Streptomyces sp. H39-C1]